MHGHPTGAQRRRQLKKLALPVPAAEYYALLARALPGTSYHDLQWNVSLTHGWSLIHASGILQGSLYTWPDPRLTPAGQTMLRVQEKRERWRRDGVAELVDL